MEFDPRTRLIFQQPVNGWSVGPGRLAVFGAVLCALISSYLLQTMGVPYAVPYGPFVAKLHPGTYMIGTAFLWLIMRQNPIASVIEFAQRERATTAMAAVVTIMLVYSVARFGTSGSAFIIDTLLAPLLLALILTSAPPALRAKMFVIIAAILAINSVIGLGEAAFQSRIIPYLRGDQPMIEDYFRATALQGHPLANALRTMIMLICAVLFAGRGRTGLLVLLYFTSLLAFGSRTGLVMAVMMLGIWGGSRFFRDLRFERVQARTYILGALGLFLGIAGVIALATFTNIGERIFSLFYFDDSAKARLIVLRVFGLLSASDIWLGMGPRKIESMLYLLSRTSSVTDIENIWLLFVMQFGSLLTILFALTLGWFLWALARNQPLAIKLAVAAFGIFMLTNNSLASKSQDMVVFVAIIIGAQAWAQTQSRLRRAEAYLMLRSAFAGRRFVAAEGAPA